MVSELTLDVYKISRCTHNYYARELKRLHLTMGQFPFMVEIAEHGGISQEKLSAELMISKSTTAVIVRQLLTAGLITREVDESDRRNFCLYATAKGLALVPQIQEVIERCHREMLSELTEIERDIFINLTEKVRIRTEQVFQRRPLRRNSAEKSE